MAKKKRPVRSLLTDIEVKALEATKAYFEPQIKSEVSFDYLESLHYLLELRKLGGNVRMDFDATSGLLTVIGMFPSAATPNGRLELDRETVSMTSPAQPSATKSKGVTA